MSKQTNKRSIEVEPRRRNIEALQKNEWYSWENRHQKLPTIQTSAPRSPTNTPTSPEPTNRYRDLSDWDDESSQESVQWIADKKLDNAASDDLEWWREIKSLRERIDRLKKQHKRDLEQEEKVAQRNLKKTRFTPQNCGTRMRKQVLHLTGGVLDADLDSI